MVHNNLDFMFKRCEQKLPTLFLLCTNKALQGARVVVGVVNTLSSWRAKLPSHHSVDVNAPNVLRKKPHNVGLQ